MSNGRSVTRGGRHLISTAVIAIVALGMAITPAAWSQVPPIPQLPDPDDDLAPLPKPLEKVRFRVVVEGTAVARAVFKGSGANVVCSVSVDGTVQETTTYGRGKGLVLEFSRYRTGRDDDEILVTRPGRRRDASFAVVATTRRQATGVVTSTPLVQPESCLKGTTDLPTTGGCGTSFASRPSLAFSYVLGRLDIDVKDLGDGFVSAGDKLPGDCPESPFIFLPALPNAWPTPFPTRPGGLAASRLFGKARTFKIKLSADVGPVNRPYDILLGKGVVTSTARHDITVRFIRQRAR